MFLVQLVEMSSIENEQIKTDHQIAEFLENDKLDMITDENVNGNTRKGNKNNNYNRCKFAF